MKTATHLITALFLSACASTLPPLPDPVDIDRRVGETPKIDSETQRSVGEVIYEIYNYEIQTDSSTRLLGPISIDVLAAKAQLSPRDPFVAVLDRGARMYCSVEPVLRVAGRSNAAHVCLRDQDEDQQLDSWKSPDGPPARRDWAELKNTAGFKQESSVQMAQTGNGFRYELLYQGLSDNVVNILYREYLDSLVRPAFQQDLSYTLEPQGPTEISFRTIRITIVSADNNAIRYRVDRGLQPAGP